MPLVVLHLVQGRTVRPRVAGMIDLAQPEAQRFARTAASQSSEADCSPHRPCDEWFDGIDMRIVDGLDRRPFDRVGAALAQVGDGLQLDELVVLDDALRARPPE